MTTKDTHAPCDCCNETFEKSALTTSEYGKDYCRPCYAENHICCTGCGDDCHISDALSSYWGDSYCENCYDERYDHCCECGVEVYRDDECHSSDRFGNITCDACLGDTEWEPSFTWRGSEAHDKMGSSRRFGIELESHRCPDYRIWASGSIWGAKEDGSVRGMEFVSPPLNGNDGYNEVINFCAQALENGTVVNESCGYHLHVDLTGTCKEERKSVALAYHYFSDIWASFVSPERRDTDYSRKNKGSKISGYGGDAGDYWGRKEILCDDLDHNLYSCRTRYVWCNWNSYSKHNTVEIRSHEATFDGQAVINWAKAHTKFVDYMLTLSVGQITRKFGGKTKETLMKELKFIWNDYLLSEYYEQKANAVGGVCA